MPRNSFAPLSALSLAALRGPLLRSSLRFTETPAPVVPPAPAPAAPAPVEPPPVVPPVAPPAPPAPAAPAAAAAAPKLSPMQRIAAIYTERTAALAERDAARTQLAAVTAERDTARTQLAAVTAERTALQARITAFEQREAAHLAAAAQLAREREDFDRMVSDGVTNALASSGVPAVTLPASVPVPAGQTAAEIFAKWDSLKGAAKTRFYREHEAVLEKPRPAAAV